MKSGVSLQQMLTEVKRQSESKEDYLIAPNRLPFSNNVSHPWVVGNKIVIDENIKKWIRQTKEYAQKDYNNHTTLWGKPGECNFR